ncbi:MAG: YaaL family protein [Bacteroidales bacterium]|nr:DUF2508 family protein [Anaerotignum sp.]MCI5678583.1 YaaL family protein [Bacteroidales bacterium]MDY3926753.1 DUF2508 family protein [Anaerotignum sp.]
MKQERLMTEGQAILAAIRQIQLQMECARSSFEDATDEALIDSYIYEIIALQKKYEYFLKTAKEMGLTNGYQRSVI